MVLAWIFSPAYSFQLASVPTAQHKKKIVHRGFCVDNKMALLCSQQDGREVAEEKIAKFKADYEEKLLQDAMQITKNQQAFFSVGKFLIPVVLGVWIYALLNGIN